MSAYIYVAPPFLERNLLTLSLLLICSYNVTAAMVVDKRKKGFPPLGFANQNDRLIPRLQTRYLHQPSPFSYRTNY